MFDLYTTKSYSISQDEKNYLLPSYDLFKTSPILYIEQKG